MTGVLSSNFTVKTSTFDGEDKTQKGMESCMASITPPPLVALSVQAILKFDGRSSLLKMYSESQVSVIAMILSEEE